MWERERGLGGTRVDKEGIILLVDECQHGWPFFLHGSLAERGELSASPSVLQVPLTETLEWK